MEINKQDKQDEFDEILYDEYYRQKLTFFYFIFTKNAVIIMGLMFFYGFYIQNWSLNQYFSLLIIALVIGYKYFFKAYKGDEFNIWLISHIGELNLSIKKRIKERYK